MNIAFPPSNEEAQSSPETHRLSCSVECCLPTVPSGHGLSEGLRPPAGPPLLIALDPLLHLKAAPFVSDAYPLSSLLFDVMFNDTPGAFQSLPVSAAEAAGYERAWNRVRETQPVFYQAMTQRLDQGTLLIACTTRENGGGNTASRVWSRPPACLRKAGCFGIRCWVIVDPLHSKITYDRFNGWTIARGGIVSEWVSP